MTIMEDYDGMETNQDDKYRMIMTSMQHLIKWQV